MKTWTTWFVAAVVMAGAGALWLTMIAPTQPHAIAHLDGGNGAPAAPGAESPPTALDERVAQPHRLGSLRD